MTTLRQPYYELSPEVLQRSGAGEKRAGKEHD
ncbi:Uncharacterised protein [Salmonella enterica subsp. enterica serovar Pullorum]|nr:Uncharacterised protein [Salmonella enterica subsp. enterica serovar Pullorum]